MRIYLFSFLLIVCSTSAHIGPVLTTIAHNFGFVTATSRECLVQIFLLYGLDPTPQDVAQCMKQLEQQLSCVEPTTSVTPHEISLTLECIENYCEQQCCRIQQKKHQLYVAGACLFFLCVGLTYCANRYYTNSCAQESLEQIEELKSTTMHQHVQLKNECTQGQKQLNQKLTTMHESVASLHEHQKQVDNHLQRLEHDTAETARLLSLKIDGVDKHHTSLLHTYKQEQETCYQLCMQKIRQATHRVDMVDKNVSTLDHGVSLLERDVQHQQRLCNAQTNFLQRRIDQVHTTGLHLHQTLHKTMEHSQHRSDRQFDRLDTRIERQQQSLSDVHNRVGHLSGRVDELGKKKKGMLDKLASAGQALGSLGSTLASVTSLRNNAPSIAAPMNIIRSFMRRRIAE